MDKTMTKDSSMKKDLHPVATSASVGVGSVRPKKHFSLLGALGLQFSVTGTPLTLGTYLSLVIGLGGSAGYFWGFFFAGFFQLVVCLAVSELASAMPHSSGYAHWAVMLASPTHARAVGFFIGWVTTIAWILIVAASCLYPAQLTLALISAGNPEYTPQSWHVYLVYCAFALSCFSINLPFVFRTVDWLLASAIFLFNSTSLYLVISLLVRALPKQSAHNVFILFVNNTGWSSDGLVFFLGLLPAVACLGAFDNVTHLTDEMETPGKQVPQVIIGSYLLSYAVGLPMILVYEFCNVDPLSLLEPVGGQPFVQLLLNAQRSFDMTIVGIVLIIFCFFISASASLISASRLYWSFSREGVLPMHKQMRKLSSRDNLPINALAFVTILTMIIGTLELASKIAMNALLGGVSLCLISAMGVVFTLALFRGRSALNPDRWFNLGVLGTPIYIIGLFWSVFLAVILCLPLYTPVTISTMNWTSVVFIGVVVLGGLYWTLQVSKRAIVSHHDADRDGQQQES